MPKKRKKTVICQRQFAKFKRRSHKQAQLYNTNETHRLIVPFILMYI